MITESCRSNVVNRRGLGQGALERRARGPAGYGPEATGILVADPEQGRAVLDEAPGVERVSWPSPTTSLACIIRE